jgi:DNA-binding transcriptional MocR family regulator
MGFIPAPIEIDADGPLPDSLVMALNAGAVACVITPRGQNPTGAALTAERAASLQEVLARSPAVLVVEDDHVGAIAGAPRRSVIGDRGRWVILDSLAKSYGPDLRLALLMGDPQTVSRVEGRQLLGCGWVSHVLQTLAVDLLTNPGVQELINHASDVYAERRRSLIEALRSIDIEATGTSGLNVWIPVAEEEPLLRGLLHLGWAVKGGETYRLESPPAIRVTTATLAPTEAEEFANAVGQTLMPQRRTYFP